MKEIKHVVNPDLPLPDVEGFANNPHIKALAQEPRWTISAVFGETNKVPINSQLLVQQIKNKQPIYLKGAPDTSENSLTNLHTLNKVVESILPEDWYTTNFAYFIDTSQDGYILLDIEKTCAPQLAKNFIETLPWVYGGLSSSGKGYHLLLPLPDNYNDLPIAWDKTVIKSGDQQYELLLRHFTTFTRRSIPGYDIPKITQKRKDAWATLYAQMCQNLKPSKRISSTTIDGKIILDEPFEHERVNEFKEAIHEDFSYDRTLESFNNDTSAWEYGHLTKYAWRIAKLNNNRKWNLTPAEQHHLLYDVVSEILPWRQKHDTLRQGEPYLAWQARGAMEYVLDTIKQRDAENAPYIVRPPQINQKTRNSLNKLLEKEW